MNTATRNLEYDHVHILRLIDVMEIMVDRKTTDVTHFENAVRVIREYADGFHHAKEENLLFPLLATKGFSREQGPIAVMLHEHDLGRKLVKGMTEGLKHYKEGDDSALVKVYENISGYGELLRSHIDKENTVLFRMADRVLSHDEQQHLLEEFAKVEDGNICGGLSGNCIKSIEDLERTYPK
jgi:hemerythrin-like domain-containing protein